MGRVDDRKGLERLDARDAARLIVEHERAIGDEPFPIEDLVRRFGLVELLDEIDNLAIEETFRKRVGTADLLPGTTLEEAARELGVDL